MRLNNDGVDAYFNILVGKTKHKSDVKDGAGKEFTIKVDKTFLAEAR